jgi:hypothetical protein
VTLVDDIKLLQRKAGVPDDGLIGPLTIHTLLAKMDELAGFKGRQAGSAAGWAPGASQGQMAWGAKVSPTFRDRVRWICGELGVRPDDLMACMAWESGRSFSPSVRNAAGSGATGLIQFMPTTARALGTTTDALALMTAEDQLNYVYKYFLPYKGKLHSLSDLYMAILWPAAVGKPDDYVLFQGVGSIAYRQNAGLDANRDARVTKAETAAKLYAMRAEGLRPENAG